MNLKRNNVLADLNDFQREAVEYFDTNLRIIAGAGSGKTKVLTRKVTYLINDLGISSSNILAVTFTNKACNEMKERISKYLYNDSDLKIYTFHSLCSNILRKFIHLLGYNNNFLILDEVDKNQILVSLYKRFEITTQVVSYKNMIQYISWAKNKNYDIYQFAEILNLKLDDPIVKVYQGYLDELALKGALDFDDLIIQAHKLLTNHSDVAQFYKKQFSYILIDEFQDTSKMQYDIIKKIVGDGTHLTIVGDPDQTIYNWRGAEVNLILDFEKEYPNSKTVVLDLNYRSTKKILDAANKLIQHNQIRYNKNLITQNTDGDDIEFYHGFSVEAEARWVVQKINELKKQKNQLKNIAILYRANYYSRPFEEALIQENINHKIFNGVKFFQRSEIKDVIAFLRVIFDGSDIALERIINVPVRGIGDTTLSKIKEYALERGESMFNIIVKDIKHLPIPGKIIKNKLFPFFKLILTAQKKINLRKISETINWFLSEIKYYEHIENNKNIRGSALDNVNELIESIKNWEQNNPQGTLGDYLNMVSLLSAADEGDNSNNYVSLMTIHSAKGLEFDNVFVVGLTEGIFPSIKVINNQEKAISYLNSEDSPIEEERRLAYVAITRARKNLFISDSRGHLVGSDTPKSPSRFIKEMGINLDEIILHKNFDINYLNSESDKKKQNKVIVGDIISHVTFGEGEVLEVKGSEIVVRFIKDKKQKTLNKDHPAIQVISS
ncbi:MULTISPECIES: ATP-dependent helicase [unclassified Mycoplasma]|uniref:ATP-dependent helicase n=1 Tax=unclassified Mycoplasma TaxID=2683645 RepID=UPI00211BD88E|nr:MULTISPECIES: UvrD-helicase domain-containing protein [unclassified Mycoplasma]UUM19586.1 UvrD-helicase domain-containing protein [Mycoplasma sp. 1578d]UUM24506.1 UvrD-helicase domain-containing protein [Mycoplasma sp. 3686d]